MFFVNSNLHNIYSDSNLFVLCILSYHPYSCTEYSDISIFGICPECNRLSVTCQMSGRSGMCPLSPLVGQHKHGIQIELLVKVIDFGLSHKGAKVCILHAYSNQLPYLAQHVSKFLYYQNCHFSVFSLIIYHKITIKFPQ